jgi:hypothetical protein
MLASMYDMITLDKTSTAATITDLNGLASVHIMLDWTGSLKGYLHSKDTWW